MLTYFTNRRLQKSETGLAPYPALKILVNGSLH